MRSLRSAAVRGMISAGSRRSAPGFFFAGRPRFFAGAAAVVVFFFFVLLAFFAGAFVFADLADAEVGVILVNFVFAEAFFEGAGFFFAVAFFALVGFTAVRTKGLLLALGFVGALALGALALALRSVMDWTP